MLGDLSLWYVGLPILIVLVWAWVVKWWFPQYYIPSKGHYRFPSVYRTSPLEWKIVEP